MGCDGDSERHAGECRFGMCRHVVEPFKCVQVMRFTLGGESVEQPVKVVAHVGVGILVDCQSATGVLHK